MEEKLRRAHTLAHRKSDVYEAAVLLAPLVDRFRRVSKTLTHVVASGALEDAPANIVQTLFEEEVDKLVTLIETQRTLGLARRLAQLDALIRVVERLHGLVDDTTELVAGLDGRSNPPDEWREPFVRAQNGYEEALTASLYDSLDVLAAVPSLARETAELLEQEKARGNWSRLSELLRDEIEGLLTHQAPLESNQLPEASGGRDGDVVTIELALKMLRHTKDHDRQGKALQQLYRKGAGTVSGCRRIREGNVGDIFTRVIGDPRSQFLHKLYAFNLLRVASTEPLAEPPTKLLDQLRPTIHPLKPSELVTYTRQMMDERLPVVTRVEALEIVALACRNGLFVGNVNDTMDKLIKILHDRDESLTPAAAIALAYVPLGRTSVSPSLLKSAIACLVLLLSAKSDAIKTSSATALGYLASNSNEHQTAIASAEAISVLVQLVASGSDDCKEAAALTLRSLASESPENSRAIAKAGAIRPLVQLLTSDSDGCKQYSAFTLGNIASASAQDKATIASAGGIPRLVQLLACDWDASRVWSAYALSELASNSPANSIAIIQAGGAYPLVELLAAHSKFFKVHAARALASISYNSLANSNAIVKAGGIRRLVELLTSDSSEVCKEWSATTLGNLADTSPENCLAATRAGAFVPLVQLLKSNSESCKGQAARALVAFASSDENINAIVTAGALPLLVQSLASGWDKCAEWSAQALGNMINNSSDDHIPTSIVTAGAIPRLVKLLSSNSDGCTSQAARALGALAVGSPDNCTAIVAAGAIRPLVQMLVASSDDCKQQSAYALANIAAFSPDIKNAIATAGAIPRLVQMLTSDSTGCKEWSAYALGNLADESPETKTAIAAAGAIRPLLQLLASNSDACKKWGAYALAYIAADSPDNRSTIATAGAIRPLIQLLTSDASNECKDEVLHALWSLAEHRKSAVAKMMIADGAVPVLEKLRGHSALGEGAKMVLDVLGYGTIRRLFK